MEADRLKILLEKYYTGEILPNEYQSLLSALKEADELSPELEAERRMLLAFESWEPIEPEGLEDRLVMTINNQSKRRRKFLRMAYSGSAAAIVLVLITIVAHIHDNKSVEGSEQIAEITVARKENVKNETFGSQGTSNTTQLISATRKISPPHSSANDDLEKSLKVADEALMEVLITVQMAKNEAIETIDNIEISQTTDYNIL